MRQKFTSSSPTYANQFTASARHGRRVAGPSGAPARPRALLLPALPGLDVLDRLRPVPGAAQQRQAALLLLPTPLPDREVGAPGRQILCRRLDPLVLVSCWMRKRGQQLVFIRSFLSNKATPTNISTLSSWRNLSGNL
jgi:hypothetical protein